MAKRRSRKPQVMQNEVLSRTLAAQSKSQIARDLGIDRQTVTRIQECHNLPQLLSDSRAHVVEKVVPDAVQSMHAQILDRSAPGDGNLAVRVLEGVGVLGGEEAPRQVVLDERTQIAINTLLPPRRADAPPRPARRDRVNPSTLPQPGQVPAAPESAPRPALGDSGSVPASPAQAEPMPEPAQPGHTWNCPCDGCSAARTFARAIVKASAASANGEVDEGDASAAQEARGGGEWW